MDTELLELDKEKIKGLDLSTLTKTLPLHENKLKEVMEHLNGLKNETKKQNQKLNGLEVRKFELETSIAKFKKIDMDLSTRESNVLQELKKARVMCPIYQYKMNNFLEKFQSKDKLKEYGLPIQWNQILNKLIEQKQKVQQIIDGNGKSVDEFIQKYLI